MKVYTTKILEEISDFHQKQNLTQSKLLCFSNVLVGTGLLTDHGRDRNRHGWLLDEVSETMVDVHNIGRGDIYLDYRNELWKRAFINHTVELNSSVDILINVKRKFFNQDDRKFDASREDINRYVEHIHEDFNDLNVLSSEVDLSTMKFTDQMLLLNRTKVFITPPGGSSFSALFLPKGSTIIFVYKKNSPRKHLDKVFWNNLSYVYTRWIEIDNMLNMTLSREIRLARFRAELI
jgi:hypothetical protein